MHSIIVTIHNGARRLPNGEILLEKVLDGIVNNTVGDYELLCMLDGCTDDSDKIVSKYENARAIVLPDVFELLTNNAAFKEAKGEYVIVVQDDQVISEYGWNQRMQKPFDNFYDVFGVTARSAFNYRFNQSSRCAYMEEEEDLKIDTDWSDIFGYQSHTNRDEGLQRDIFAVRNNVCRGPLMLDHEDMLNLDYFDEIFAPQDQDDADLCYRAWKKLNKVVGAYWIDYESDNTWGSTRPDGHTPAPWLFKAHHKNTRIVWDRHHDIILNENHDDNRKLN